MSKRFHIGHGSIEIGRVFGTRRPVLHRSTQRHIDVWTFGVAVFGYGVWMVGHFRR